MTEKKAAIYNEYIKNQQSQIEKHKQELLNKNNEEARLQNEEYLASMKKMEDLYNQNKDCWVQEIVSNCLK